jgi:hypothetical protein
MPPGLNPTRSEKYGFDSYQFFPNFIMIFGASGFTVHTHWPTGPHSHIFETEMYYPPPTTHKERLGQELTVTYLNGIILEDASPSEGLQAMLNSGALTHFTMNDEEILLRHFHKVVGDYVEAGEKAVPERFDRAPELIGTFTVLLVENIAPDAPLHDRIHKRYRAAIDIITNIVERGQRDGQYRQDIDAATTAVEILAFINGMETLWLLDPSIPLTDAFTGYADSLGRQLAPRSSK